MDPVRAIRAVARETGLPIETVEAHWRKDLRARARRGLTNAEIATRTGLHRNTISWIIQAALKARR